ncbi:metallophosphoesterase family protein [Desnuesiella massiliensis]|uniref:metallophosphoesterase family protein n=1 Tax=Desnuesiella massiliensis TaxID=1650662 RepID=UPI0006E1DBB5|nr:metallophosphoesterase [Desnuesiella massiliensis]
MKKIFIGISLTVIFILCIGAFIYNKNSEKVFQESGKDNREDGKLNFSVLGDIHENISHFDEAIKDLYEINPKMDAMIFNGDVVDQGLKKQYDSMKKAINDNNKILPPTIIKNIGNHEFFDYEKGENTSEESQEFINRYLEFSGEKSVYHERWIEGYHFISLGSEEGYTKKLGSTKAFISDNQLNWLKEKLAEKYEKDKPIFVFLHQNISSIFGWNGTDQGSKIKDILSKYPEAIIFTSHTHATLEKEKVRVNQPFTIVHTGAVNYTFVVDEKGNRQRTEDAQGIYVEVDGNKVKIKGRDFKRRSWIFTEEIFKVPEKK